MRPTRLDCVVTRAGGVLNFRAKPKDEDDEPIADEDEEPTTDEDDEDDEDDERAGSPDGLGVMRVQFSALDTWYEISSYWEGYFVERVASGALTESLAANGPDGNGSLMTMYDHGMDFSIGTKSLGKVLAAEERDGYGVTEVDMFDTSYCRDLLPGIRAGAYGSSFAFYVLRDEWDYEPGASNHNPDGLPERTILEAEVYEAGPVAMPANPAATVGMRSTTDSYYERMARVNPSRVDAARLRASVAWAGSRAPGARAARLRSIQIAGFRPASRGER